MNYHPDWIKELPDYKALSSDQREKLSQMEPFRVQCLTLFLSDEEGDCLLRKARLEYFRKQLSQLN